MISKRSTLIDVVFAICTELERRDLTVVLVGGSAATYYAPQAYQSSDADFVAQFLVDRQREKDVIAGMASLGYRLNGNTFEHEHGSPFTVEFPKGPLAIGGDLLTDFNTVKRGKEILHVIKPADSVRDRLAHYYFYNDRTALRAAVSVAQAVSDLIDLAAIEAWSRREDNSEKFADFRDLLARFT